MPNPVLPSSLQSAYESIVTSITEHAFSRHRNEFNNQGPGGQSLKTEFGPTIDIDSKADMDRMINDTFNDPNTKYLPEKGVTNPSTFRFYNPKTNVLIIINKNQIGSDGCVGTVYRPNVSLAGVPESQRMAKVSEYLSRDRNKIDPLTGRTYKQAGVSLDTPVGLDDPNFRSNFENFARNNEANINYGLRRNNVEPRKITSAGPPRASKLSPKEQLMKAENIEGFVTNNGKKGYFVSQDGQMFTVDYDKHTGNITHVSVARHSDYASARNALNQTYTDCARQAQGLPRASEGNYQKLMSKLQDMASGSSKFAKILKVAGKGLKILGPIGMAVGVVTSSVEARAMYNKASPLVDYEVMSQGALNEYNLILIGKVAAEFNPDPTGLSSEALIEGSYHLWHDKHDIPEYADKDLNPSTMLDGLANALTEEEKIKLIDETINMLAEEAWVPVELRSFLNNPNVSRDDKLAMAQLAVAKRVGTLEISQMDGFIVYSIGEKTVRDIPNGELLNDIQPGKGFPLDLPSGSPSKPDFQIEQMQQDNFPPPPQLPIINDTNKRINGATGSRVQSSKGISIGSESIGYIDPYSIEIADPENTYANLSSAGDDLTRLDVIHRTLDQKYTIQGVYIQAAIQEATHQLRNANFADVRYEDRAVDAIRAIHKQWKTEQAKTALEEAIIDWNEPSPLPQIAVSVELDKSSITNIPDIQGLK